MKDIVGQLKSFLGLSRKLRSLSFREAFERFRQVLENNNRALEIITDMGEKLGGDYLFDVNYIKDAYSRLSAVVAGAIGNFNTLTRGRYEKLPEVFARIDSQVTGMIYDVASVTGERVFFYEDISWYMSREVGGKNSTLAELSNYLKLNVPEAFAITTHAFDEFMEYNGLSAAVDDLRPGGPDEEKLSRLRDLIMNAGIPPKLGSDIDAAIEKMKERCAGPCFLAIRSSGEEEDGEFSFAGQFETVLNVPLDAEAVKTAYRRVLASLFSAKAAAYQKRLGYEGQMKMAVGCVLMVDAVSSGVIYSSSPDGDRGVLIVNATWGLGESIVEGRTDSDFYRVRKDAVPEILSEKTGGKESMVINRPEGGTERVSTPADRAGKPSLTPEQVKELARQAILIEKHFRGPQDIEWAIDKKGQVFILQARPLRIEEKTAAKTGRTQPRVEKPGEILMKDRGVIVQKGTGGGTVFIVRNPEELEHFPKGSVLVARHDSSNFVRVMPFVSAIITDIGTPTSHMSSLCREFKVPTIVNAGDATQTLKQGQKVTVEADGDGLSAVYEGIHRDLIEHAEKVSMKMEEVYEYRKKRFVLRYISPLNLVDPLLDDFSPERCKTIHDILRFMHEKSVAELVDNARYGTSMLKKQAAIKLDLPIPAGIIVIDIGGGLSSAPGEGKATLEQITSVPLRAIVRGMTHPGVWHSHAVSLNVNDFMSSMMRMSDITAGDSEYVGYNVAVASGEYMNLSLRFGYHFNMIDCFCSENARNNHLYFRFVGGATDIVKRSRRIELLATILREYGFNVRSKGDLIIARLANISREELVGLLDKAGRLIAFTRQLDAVLNDDADVELYSRNFIEGKYEF